MGLKALRIPILKEKIVKALFFENNDYVILNFFTQYRIFSNKHRNSNKCHPPINTRIKIEF